MQLTHVFKAQQFDRKDLEELFEITNDMRIVAKYGTSNLLHNKLVALLFYEPSTRTRFSFIAACLWLGARYAFTESARHFSSVSKGETLEDTIRVMSSMYHALILRHDENGAAEAASNISPVPIINAGDGPGQHPTQALLDVYTIQRELGTIDGLTIGMCGDLARGRTVRSLSYMLTKFNIAKIVYISHPKLRMKQDIKDHLEEHDVRFEETDDLAEAAKETDILYQTRTQTERDNSGDDTYIVPETEASRFIIDKRIALSMKPDARIMHPLPRVDEITQAVDDDPRAAYFRQAENGLYVRMALLKAILA